MKNLIAFLFILAGPSLAFSLTGEWGSSGGEFLRDQHNPWFVKNTEQVRYCLVVDEDGFSASPEKSKELIQKAFEYWKKELGSRGGFLGLGTQAFHLSHPSGACQGGEDLEFRLGYDALTSEQKDFFATNHADPQDYVGVAVRTNYDRAQLRGKGFIFIASDHGSHPYNRGGIEENLWSHEGLLFRILQHEIGHIFGIAHTEDGFMAADFPENMIRHFRSFRMIQTVSFFEPQNAYDWCPFETNSPELCFKIETQDRWSSFRLTAPHAEGGLVTYQAKVTKRFPPTFTFPLRIYLTPEQKVFEVQNGETWIKGPARQSFKILAEASDGSADPKGPLLLELRPEKVDLFFFNQSKNRDQPLR